MPMIGVDCVCYTYCGEQPTGENGATRAPIIVDLSRESSLGSKAIILQIDNKSQQVSASKSPSMNICDSFDPSSHNYYHCVLNANVIAALRHNLQDRLGKAAPGKNRDEIYLKLRTSTGKSFF